MKPWWEILGCPSPCAITPGRDARCAAVKRSHGDASKCSWGSDKETAPLLCVCAGCLVLDVKQIWFQELEKWIGLKLTQLQSDYSQWAVQFSAFFLPCVAFLPLISIAPASIYRITRCLFYTPSKSRECPCSANRHWTSLSLWCWKSLKMKDFSYENSSVI